MISELWVQSFEFANSVFLKSVGAATPTASTLSTRVGHITEIFILISKEFLVNWKLGGKIGLNGDFSSVSQKLLRQNYSI